jgi:hypothetical protein
MSTDKLRVNRRRRLIVLPGLQKRLIGQCSIWPFTVLVCAVLLIGFTWRRLMVEFAETGAELPSLGLLMIALAVIVGASGFVVIYQSVLFSNKIAGPLFRIHKVLEAMRDGDYSQRIHFREHDLLLETADLLNETTASVEQRHAEPPSPRPTPQPEVAETVASAST